MPANPPVALVARWGDAVYQFALLIADDGQQAEQLTVAAFRRAPHDPIAQAETALFGSVLSSARGRRPGLTLPGRKHVLPQDWARLPAFERALLGLWLLRGFDGPRLAELAQLAPDVLITRLAAVLAPALDELPGDEFSAWLAGVLGLGTNTPAYVLDQDTRTARDARRQRLDRLAAILRDALDSLHLPPACAEAIEAPDQAEVSGTWRRSPVWIAVLLAGVLIMLVLVIAPWRGRETQSSGGVAPAIDSPTALVQRALDTWEPQPFDGMRHVRVWAAEDKIAERAVLAPNARAFRTPQPHITDVWVDPNGGFRVEVSRDKQTVEWMLGDGDERLEYAVDAPYSACEWIDVGVEGRNAQRFDVPRDQQHEVFQTRLTLGAYGSAYHILQDALQAGDLRSYGRRLEGKTRLIALGYTASGGRNILLLFDAATQQLRAVREVAAQGTQAAARDLWRLEADETLPGTLPRGRPEWVTGRTIRQSSLLDPSCPELRPELVVSLRSLAGRNLWWGQPYVPRALPPGVERMLLISPSRLAEGNFAAQDVRVLLLGPDRWLRLQMGQGGRPSAAGRKVGVWDVTFDDGGGILRASLCRLIVDSAQSPYCSPAFELTATGWSEPELLALIQDLTPVQPDNWHQLDPLFVDGAPLAPETEQLLTRAVDAARPPAASVQYTELTSETRVDPRRQVWQDPYHIPLDVVQPRAIRQRQWLRYEAGTLREMRTEQVLPDGTLLSAYTTGGATSSGYQRVSGTLWTETQTAAAGPLSAVPPGLALILPLLESSEPITVSTDVDGIVLRQPAGAALTNWGSSSWQVVPPYTGDLEGRIERRVWLDPAAARPRKTELVMIDDAGSETLLNRATIAQTNSVAAMPEGSLVDPAALPEDTLVFQQNDPAQPPTLNNGAGLGVQHPERVLVLPFEARNVQSYREDANLEQALQSHIEAIDQTGVTDVRRYELPGIRPLLIVRQGQRDLLALALRTTMLNLINNSSIIRASAPIAVTLDGRPSTAWLIEGGQPMLVAELDGVLLTFSGPDTATLRGPVAEALGQMVWQPAE